MCAMLSKYWPSGYFSVTLNGLLVAPNCEVQKIHFPDFLPLRLHHRFCNAKAKLNLAKIFFKELGKSSEEKKKDTCDYINKWASKGSVRST